MFVSARIRLTLWYLAILAVIVGLLSLVLYRILVNLQQAELRTFNHQIRQGVARLFAGDEQTLAYQILAIDVGVLALATLGAYVLATRTLEPIQQAMERQARFAAAASHELRTPLTVLQGSLEVALLSRRTPEEYEEILAQAAAEAARLGGMVSDLLALARAQRDAETLNRSLCDLREIVEEAVSVIRPLAEQRGLRLDVRLGGSLLVDGDAIKLRQALSNLLHNAVRYTPAGGTVVVAGRHERRQVFLTVRDSGQGIPPRHLPHIFEPFYRADTARGSYAGHVGLGLALADWVVRAHGGRIAVESRIGSGTTFTVVLPAVR